MNNDTPVSHKKDMHRIYSCATYAVNYNRYGYELGHCFVAAYSLSHEVDDIVSELDCGDMHASIAMSELVALIERGEAIVGTGDSPHEAMMNLHEKVVADWRRARHSKTGRPK